MTARETRLWVCVLALFGMAWAGTCFLNLYRMDCAGLDDWCCLAPGAACTRPFHITAPLLGKFLGADHTWGFHWPGAPLLYSGLFALVPFSPMSRVLLFMGICVGVVAVTFLLLRRYLQMPLVAASGAVIILCDWWIGGMMSIARPEMISTLTLTSLLVLLSGSGQSPEQTWRMAGAAVCFFALPLLHPILVPLGALLCFYVAWRAWRRGESVRGLMFAGCYVAGVIALASWFYFQPDAWSQFKVNAQANAHPFGWGETFVGYLGNYARPLYSGGWLYLLAFVGCVTRLPWRRTFAVPDGNRAGETPEFRADWTLPILTLLGGTASAQLFHNPCYQTIMLPEAILMAVAVLETLAQRRPRREAAVYLVPGLLGFAALHGAFWGWRILNYVRAGQPNMRAEIHALVQSFPSTATILIPDTLWEEGLRQPGRFLLDTPPIACSRELRQSYEAAVLRQTRAGDLLVLKDHGLVPFSTPLPPEQWEYLRRYEHRFPTRAFWGYDLTVYRRR